MVAGCGGADTPDDSGEPSPSSATSSPTPEPAEPTYLPAGDLPRPLSLADVGARTVPAGPFADFAVAAGDGVWVSGVAPGVVRYDADGRITARARVAGDVAQALDTLPRTVLVPSLNPSHLHRVDATTGAVLGKVPLPASPLVESSVGAAAGRAYVLVEPSEPRIVVIEGDEIVEELPAPEGAVAVRAGYGSLWVPTTDHTLERYDLASDSWTTIPSAEAPLPRCRLRRRLGDEPGDGSVSRVDARSGAVEQIRHWRAHRWGRPHGRRERRVAAYGLNRGADRPSHRLRPT